MKQRIIRIYKVKPEIKYMIGMGKWCFVTNVIIKKVKRKKDEWLIEIVAYEREDEMR